MADELEIINNPDSTPASATTGYGYQNTCLVAQRTGLDLTVVVGGTGQCTCKISGPVDVNGVMYTIKSNTILTPVSSGRWYVYLESGSDADHLTPTLTDDSGTWDDDKNGRYNASNQRILNWIIDYDGTDCRVVRWLTPESDEDANYIPDLDTQPETWITGNGTWTAPRTKYYNIWVTGRGYGSGGNIISGGGAGATGIIRIKINAGDVWTATFSTSAGNLGGNTVFTDGVTTLTCNNAWNTANRGGNQPSGFDINSRGTSGILGSSGVGGGGGAPSIYGGGGYGGDITLPNGGNGEAYGAGGGGAYTASYAQGAPGSGVIRIIG